MDSKNLEKYLFINEFEKIFQMDKSTFGKMAKWKRDSIKKKHGLF